MIKPRSKKKFKVKRAREIGDRRKERWDKMLMKFISGLTGFCQQFRNICGLISGIFRYGQNVLRYGLVVFRS